MLHRETHAMHLSDPAQKHSKDVNKGLIIEKTGRIPVVPSIHGMNPDGLRPDK